ncbi:MAG: TRAP transporter large permease subunit, partial [Pseudomonadota bacterium]
MAATDAKPETVDLDDLVASSDTGARAPKGWVGKLLLGVALFWSLFQIYYASPLPFALTALTGLNFTLNDTEARAIHLALALFLGFMAYPAFKRSPRDRVPVLDWVFAAAGSICAAYIWFMYAALAERPGLSTPTDITVAVIGLVCLLEATRRALGPPLMIVALVFLAYVFFGDSSVVPEAIRWKGASLNRAMDHMWLTTEGVFGIALGVSTSFVFLFVLFGSLLDRAGAGNYFIQVAFALLGHLRGGPAKAAVVSSGMTGLISGSSIANVVTTG